MGCFLFACVPFVFLYTGEPGKIIDYRKRVPKELEEPRELKEP